MRFEPIAIVGQSCILPGALDPEAVGAVQPGGFQFLKVNDIRHPDLLPGAAKYGDIDALLKLAPNKAWNVDEKGLPDWLK